MYTNPASAGWVLTRVYEGCHYLPWQGFDEGGRGADAERSEQELCLLRRVDPQQRPNRAV